MPRTTTTKSKTTKTASAPEKSDTTSTVRKMLINVADAEEFRVAIVEDGRLEEFALESTRREQTKGNIYKGVVTNIEPSLQAAFVNYGGERQGFLPISEVHPEYFQKEIKEGSRPRIQEVLKKGQELLVQVIKEEMATKGAYLTTYISLPGRFIVLLPGQSQVGISRKISSEEERQQLAAIIQELKIPTEIGVIVRTVAAEAKKRELQKDYQYLFRIWEDIKKSAGPQPSPSLIYKELDLVIRTIRDYFTADINEILIDDPETCRQIKNFFHTVDPRKSQVVKLYKEKRPIFSKYQIEEQLERIYEREVPLKSGGTIVISPTEALVSIDVNSGRCVQPKDIEDTAFKTNVEAAQEISRQLRLRDLGGLIVIDFIDMKDRKHRKEVEKELKTAFKKEKAKVTVGHISKFGLLELSRQRLRPTASSSIYITCPQCLGRGQVKSVEASGLAFLRKVAYEASRHTLAEVRSQLPSDVAAYLLNRKRKELLELEAGFHLTITIEGKDHLPVGEEQVEFLRRPAEPEKDLGLRPSPDIEIITPRKGLQHEE